MDDQRRSDTYKTPANPLLSAARGGFSLDDIGANPLLVPVTENSSSVLPSDVDVDLHAGQQTASPSPVPVPAPLSTPTHGGGFVSSFTSALFGSLPSSEQPSPTRQFPTAGPCSTEYRHPSGQPGAVADAIADDAFQPVSLEPATGPTPTFYNPTAFRGPPTPTSTPPPDLQGPAPFVNHWGGGRPFQVQPSGASTGGHPAGPLTGPSADPPSGSLPTAGPTTGSPFGRPPPSSASLYGCPSPSGPSTASTTPTRPPSLPAVPILDPSAGGSPFATPTGPPSGNSALSFASASGSPFSTPTGPPPPGTLAGAPPQAGGPAGPSNTFRLGGRRPVYAPVPGLDTSGPLGSAPPPSSTFPPFPTPVQNTPFTMSLTAPPSVDSASSPTGLPPQPFNTAEYYEAQVSMTQDQTPPPMYRTVYQHWFFKREVESKVIWQPFSMSDSLALETKFLSPDLTIDTEVPTDGGRYDVNILRRQRVAVYWEETSSEVRRCSWFYKSNADNRYVPYDENVATRLEEEYKLSYTQNDWQRRVEFPNDETVVFHSANVMVHYLSSTSPDAWGNAPVSFNMHPDGTHHRPRVVKRGVDEFDIESGESEIVDHLLFLVHGIGSACDLKFRSVVEVVDDFRSVSMQLVESHFSSSVERGQARRIEVLPVSWHEKLHSEDIERQLRSITLPSIPKLRHLTNDTLIDILFYTSPIYCQTIIDTVAKELNSLYALFLKRNPSFNGGVSLGGHSLGSLILFDLLWHQKAGPSPTTPANSPSTPPIDEDAVLDNGEESEKDSTAPPNPIKRKLSHRISYVMMGPAGTGQPFISYPQLTFQPDNFFALGSPIGVFVTVRGIDKLGEDFQLPTCPAFFNIFHPYDLVAYRIETLIKSDMENIPPVLIPHHKGRKRMHLELKETVARMGADLKQKVLDSVRSTWNSVYHLAMFHRSNEGLTEEMSQVLENEMTHQSLSESDIEEDLNIIVGKLNGGRRIDYVLQEAPLESFNEYLFAIGSHVCYWKSEDTMLLMLKEMYRSAGVNVDSQVPQQQINPPIGIPSLASPSDTLSPYSEVFSSSQPALLEPTPLFPTSSQQILGMDPTAPPSDSRVAGPPPVSGFYRK